MSIVSQRSRLIAAARPEEGAAALAARFGAPSERPALRKDLVIRRLVQMGEVVYVFKNARANAYYNFDEGDMVLIRLFDGTRTRHEILEAYQAEFPNETVEMNIVLDYDEMLRKFDLLEQSTSEQHLATLAGLKTARQRAAEDKAEGFDIFFLLFHVLDPDKFLNRTAKYVRWLWSPARGRGRPPLLRLGLRRHLSSLGPDLGRDDGALRVPAPPPSGRHSVFLHPDADRRRPRVRARVRDEVLRRRGSRHRSRAALLHSGLLLRYDRLDPLREQVSRPLGDSRPAFTSRPGCASSPSSSGSCPIRIPC